MLCCCHNKLAFCHPFMSFVKNLKTDADLRVIFAFGRFVRQALLQVAKVNLDVYTSILLSGSGTFATEATLRSIFGHSKKKVRS